MYDIKHYNISERNNLVLFFFCGCTLKLFSLAGRLNWVQWWFLQFAFLGGFISKAIKCVWSLHRFYRYFIRKGWGELPNLSLCLQGLILHQKEIGEIAERSKLAEFSRNILRSLWVSRKKDTQVWCFHIYLLQSMVKAF